jgi:hypothetical protein
VPGRLALAARRDEIVHLSAGLRRRVRPDERAERLGELAVEGGEVLAAACLPDHLRDLLGVCSVVAPLRGQDRHDEAEADRDDAGQADADE